MLMDSSAVWQESLLEAKCLEHRLEEMAHLRPKRIARALPSRSHYVSVVPGTILPSQLFSRCAIEFQRQSANVEGDSNHDELFCAPSSTQLRLGELV
jgi:hypothetical protein